MLINTNTDIIKDCSYLESLNTVTFYPKSYINLCFIPFVYILFNAL